jgi:hypothetical protein
VKAALELNQFTAESGSLELANNRLHLPLGDPGDDVDAAPRRAGVRSRAPQAPELAGLRTALRRDAGVGEGPGVDLPVRHRADQCAGPGPQARSDRCEPVEGRRPPKSVRKKPFAPAGDDVRLLLQALANRDPELADVVTLMASTGM